MPHIPRQRSVLIGLVDHMRVRDGKIASRNDFSPLGSLLCFLVFLFIDTHTLMLIGCSIVTSSVLGHVFTLSFEV